MAEIKQTGQMGWQPSKSKYTAMSGGLDQLNQLERELEGKAQGMPTSRRLLTTKSKQWLVNEPRLLFEPCAPFVRWVGETSVRQGAHLTPRNPAKTMVSVVVIVGGGDVLLFGGK
jgi:hypothetical protein